MFKMFGPCVKRHIMCMVLLCSHIHQRLSLRLCMCLRSLVATTQRTEKLGEEMRELCDICEDLAHTRSIQV